LTFKKIIKVARGLEISDLVIKNARIINVLSGDIHKGDVAVVNGIIAGIGQGYKGLQEIDIEGSYLSPSFIDGHVHLESSMITPYEFAKAVIPNGTTTVVADPHEIANVLGLDGISFMREATKDLPLDVYIMLPSCVPATQMETSGSKLLCSDISRFIKEPWVLGIGEMMNFPGVIDYDESVIEKVLLPITKRVDGHAPGLLGKELCAYISAGISSDHECSTAEEAKEKLRMGMYLMIREGTAAKDLERLLPAVDSFNSRRCFFVTDDRHPHDLYEHINSMVRMAVDFGIEPLTAVQMGSINTAEYFKISNLGAVAPGYKGDMLVFENLKDFNPSMVFKAGKLVAENQKMIQDKINYQLPQTRGSVNVKWIERDNFKINAISDRIKIINIMHGSLLTKCTVEDTNIINGFAESNTQKDLLKIAVIERHRASGNIGLGFVKGFGLKSGAIASTVSHDSHNMVVVGTNDQDMYYAAVELVKSQGGKIVVQNNKTLEHLRLPVAGLISDLEMEEVIIKIKNLGIYAKQLGCKIEDVFMTLSFLSLAVIPELKITDRGLIDVNRFEITSLFV
jgi:adenine deaminase